MSLRTIQRTAIMSVLALGALSASGCDDDETKDTSDAGDNGGSNNNNNNNGDVDAGEEDAGGPKPLMCDGDEDPCTDNNLGGITLKACCTEGADVCGLDTSVLAAVGVPFAGCYERAAPGVASEFCGGFFDMIDVKDGDKQFNLSIAQRMLDAATGFCAELTEDQKNAAINFAPCCTPKGECGVFIDNVEFMGSFNLDLGCVAASELMPAPAPEDPPPACMQNPATARRPTTLPYCNVDTGAGECPEKLTAALCGPLMMNNIPCTVGDPTPDWLCAQYKLPKKGETAPPVVTGRIDGFPANACGCGTDKAFAGGGPFCFSYVATTVCGAIPLVPTAKPGVDGVQCVAGYPELVSGCGADNGPANYPPRCIAHVAQTVIGCDEVVKGSPFLNNPAIPNIACGCGETVANTVGPTNPAFCLSYLPTDACGTTPACTEGQDCDPDGAGVDKGPTDGTCRDFKGSGGTVEGPNITADGVTNGDDIGDFCQAKPPA